MERDDQGAPEAYLQLTNYRRAAGIASIINYLQKGGFLPPDFTGMKAVELGAGDGSGLFVLKLLGLEVTGIDSFKIAESIERAKSLDYLQKLPQYSLDFIFVFNAVSTVWIVKTVEEARKVLKPNGLVVLTHRDVNETAHDKGFPPRWPYFTRRSSVKVRLSDYTKDGPVCRIKDFVDPGKLAKRKKSCKKD